MLFIIGSVVVVACVIGGYIANGGHMEVLFQPFEWLIIIGAAIGAFIISNRKPVLTSTLGAITGLLKSERYDKDAYLELLSLLYTIFKLAKSKGRSPLRRIARTPTRARSSSAFRASIPTTTRWSFCVTTSASSPSAPTTITRWRR
jgi:chemotaxis protein MotA